MDMEMRGLGGCYDMRPSRVIEDCIVVTRHLILRQATSL